ncbi:prephenate dehydratase [Corynebacterium sp. zg-331]|uniref:prephenate dehydratase n=1 Tax=unclassified Corynebacterium TaxID=2624378 RepID=UPI00128B31EF|nr:MULTISPECIES: prephenate dehydratase [unclassified Corynebacterium]MBC3186833.1 prephenate dehydratase [Corynebacterium sp. zg-331]MPV53313.1 prephenate dehydratase [Corynebacterium sp. zg331]
MTITVAYLGPAGTFTEAALWQFAQEGAMGVSSGQITALPVDSPARAVAAVTAGSVDYACLAIENSVDGPVTQAFDALRGAGVQIYRETDLCVAFSLMVRPGTERSAVRTLITHPVAHQQIRGWLARNLPEASFVPASSNAAAARAVAEGRADAAAAPHRAAQLWGLDVLAQDIADVPGARTRFVLVGPRGVPTPRTGHDRTSVVFTLPNQPGTLAAALGEFARRGVDMSRIESRPTRDQMGAYHFYVDLVGHIDDAPVAEALRDLWLRAETLTFLGSWPAGREDSPTATTPGCAELDWVTAARTGKELP